MADKGRDMSTSTSVQDSVRAYLEQYFAELGGNVPTNVYQNLLELVERPLLEEVMKRAGNNQCRATRYLGLARGTVIKKLKLYGLIKTKQRATPSRVREEELV